MNAVFTLHFGHYLKFLRRQIQPLPAGSYVRHIGPKGTDLQAMLEVIGCKSLDELVDRAIPGKIRLRRPALIT